MDICPKCNKDFDERGKWGIKKFCSRKCSNSRIHSEITKNKISKSISEFIKNNSDFNKRPNLNIDKKCPICKQTFSVLRCKSHKIFCSNKCRHSDVEYNFRKKPKGGYREGSGRSKPGYYTGIYCGSTYELCWVIYSLDHNVHFKRFDGFLTDGKLKYYPDFFLPDENKIIEIKGYENPESVIQKTELAQSFGYTVNVLRKDDLRKIFDYVSKKFNTNNFYELYDNFTPKYSYNCNFCNREFISDKERKTEYKCCSRGCSARLNRKLRFKQKVDIFNKIGNMYT